MIIPAVFTSPGPVLFQLGPITLRWYGLLIALAVLIGLNLSSWLAKQRNLESGLISDLLPILVLAAIIVESTSAIQLIYSGWLVLFCISSNCKISYHSD